MMSPSYLTVVAPSRNISITRLLFIAAAILFLSYSFLREKKSSASINLIIESSPDYHNPRQGAYVPTTATDHDSVVQPINSRLLNYPVKIEFSGSIVREKTSGPSKPIETTTLIKGDGDQLPLLEVGMVNVTDNGGGYKIHSSNNRLKLIAIPFSKKEIPDGYTEGDVHIFFYNKAIKRWEQLKRDSLNIQRNIVYSTNTEDGDYINAIIKAPESPETTGFTSTTLRDIKLGDPASMIELLQPPSANSQGNAALNFHIESPAGRQGLEPNLNISYSSDAGNGILGEGWSLSGVSTISVETRWGVPQYEGGKESETYLLDGQMLAQGNKNNDLTLAHRDLTIDRNDGVVSFFRRREINGDRIERVGSIGNYIWVITDKNGTKYYYGGKISNNKTVLDAVLKDGNKIAEWKLRRIEDQFENSIEYFYNTSELSFHDNTIKSINLSKIQYTIFRDDKKLKNLYEVNLAYGDRDINKDFAFNARYGFLSSTNSKKLEFIKIISVDFSALDGPKSVNISKYKFNYSNGSYNKLLLDSISKYGYDNEAEKFFYSQKFNYYSLDSLKGNYFTPASMAIPSSDFLGKSVTGGKLGFGGAIGVGLPDFQFQSKSLSFDTRFSYKENKSEAEVSFVDIDGDSKPDILKKQGNNISYMPNTSSFDKISFGAARPVSGVDGFSLDDGSSFGVGVEINGPTRSRIYAGVDNNTSNSYTKIYFADANGDGLLDIVDNGQVKFNTYKNGAAGIRFDKSSANTGNPIIAGSSIGTDLVKEDNVRQAAELQENIKHSPLHDAIRLWIAPDSGTIIIDAPVKLLKPVLERTEEDSTKYKETADGVWVSVQQNGTAIVNRIHLLPDDFTEKSISKTTRVAKGDKILFRVQSGNTDIGNGDYDQVVWKPNITYTSKNNDRHYFDAFDRNTFTYNALNDYRRVKGIFNLPDSGHYIITGSFSKPQTKDSVTLKIRITGKIIVDSFPDLIKVKRSFADGGDTMINVTNYKYKDLDSTFSKTLNKTAQVVSTNFLKPQLYLYNTSLSFDIIPASNFSLDSIEWKPKIVYNYFDTSQAEPANKWKKDSVICYPSINFKGAVIKSGLYIKAIDSGDVRISPVVTLGVKNKPVTMIISDKDTILLKKKINQSTFLRDTFSFARDKGQLISVAYEIDNIDDLDTTIATGNIPSYLLIPHDIANWVVPQTGSYSFFGVGKGSLARSVFSRNGVDFLPHNRDTLANVILKENDVISFLDTITRKPSPFSVMMTQASAVFAEWGDQDFGKLYRGWGQGVFNATGFLTSDVPVALLKLVEQQRNEFYETRFFSMPFDTRTAHYTGVNSKTYLSGDTISSSRLAMADVRSMPLFIVKGSINAAGASAVVKYSRTKSLTVAGGAFGVTGNKSVNAGTTSFSDYMDLNGDRYPDILGQSSIQFTTSLGGLQPNANNIRAGLQESKTNSFGINLGGVFFEPFLASGRSPSQSSNKASTAGARLSSVLSGLSGGYNKNDDDVDVNLYDINGDGLPDRVQKGGAAFINLGAGFSSNSIPWNFNEIQSSSGQTQSFGGGFNIDNNSISGGITFAKTDVDQQNSLLDINGDGLIDKVVRSDGGVDFVLNSGSGMSAEASQHIGLNNTFDITQSQSESKGASIAYTFSPHIFAVLIPVCKIVFNVSSNIGTGTNIVNSQWTDINGDGFVDYIKYNSNSVSIMISNLGKINKLKNLSGPLGSTYVIDYKHNKADYDHPGGKWVMASLVTSDGVDDDGGKSKSTFDYDGGKYDRFEREFLGFHQVVTTDFLKNAPFRKSVDEYNNDNYFVMNQVAKQWVDNSTGGKYAVKENEYFQRIRTKTNRTNVFPPVPSTFLKVIVMQIPVKTQKEYAQEGEAAKVLLNQTDYTYDTLLNVTSYSYREGENPVQQQQSFYKADITYKSIDKIIYGLPATLIVKNAAGKILKKVKANYPKNFRGKLQSDTVYFDDKNFATTSYEYDGNSGNLKKKTYPNGGTEEFEYDELFETYVKRIIDPYKLENKFEYDYRFGLDTKRTLTNGLSIKTKYDAFGRIVKIQGPRQSNIDIDNADFTMKVEYRHQNTIPCAVIKHFDEANTEDGIYTINFIDGYGRNIQAKKTGVVNGIKHWIVSGRQHYDELQRIQLSYYPRTQAYDVSGDMLIGAIGSTIFKGQDEIPPTTREYDVLDRLLTTRLPNGKLYETNKYTLKKDDLGNLSYATISTYTDNGKLNKKELFSNGSGLNSTEIFYQDPADEALKKITRFSYDPLHRLDSVFNVHSNKDFIVIANAYDWAGRKIRYQNISSGICQYEYDRLNNLTRKITAGNEIIEHEYEYRRIIRTNYPKHPEDSVLYVYSDKQNAGNFSVGKVVFQVDATGAQSFTYDEFGNISQNVRNIVAPFDTTYTFATGYKYDSWGRLQDMIYPSGETVKYQYDIAGNLVRVFGTKHGESALAFPYVNDISYDKFEQRQSLTYGNGLSARYRYEDTLRRLQSLITLKNATEIMVSKYEYDDLNNVKLNTNQSAFPGMDVVNMRHAYTYNNQNQLASATGQWNSNTKYDLFLGYDDQFNIQSRSLKLLSPTVNRQISSSYKYQTTNPLQLEAMQDNIRRVNSKTGSKYSEQLTASHFYDNKGNDTRTSVADSFQSNVNERKILWDEENRIRAISTNGYVSVYTYDANGDRTIKMSNETEGVYVNGLFAANQTKITSYSLYVNPYFSVRNARGIGTKHIYIGKERIVSQLTSYSSWPTINDDIAIRHPERDTLQLNLTLIAKNKIIPVRYAKKMLKTEGLFNSYFDSLEVPHTVIPHNALTKTWPALVYPIHADPSKQEAVGTVDNMTDANEKLRYFYHSNYLGSASFISDKDAAVVQYVEYLPFGETFMEQRKNYSSQFLFNGKEQDQETGLYYYGARYYDPATYQWLGVDPLAEKYAGISPYNYCLNNPIRMKDDNGRESEDIAIREKQQIDDKYIDLNSFLSQQIGDAGDERGRYAKLASKLDPKDGAGRTALKIGSREKTPATIRNFIEAVRPEVAPKPGSGGSANVTNPTMNKFGVAAKYAGATLLIAGIAYEGYTISQAENKSRALMQSSFGMLGSSGGGLLGAALASPSGPGAVVGGIGGAMVGGQAGRAFGGWLYDTLNK